MALSDLCWPGQHTHACKDASKAAGVTPEERHTKAIPAKATTQPTCSACGWRGQTYSFDSAQDERNAHTAADRHAWTKHGDSNRPSWARKRAGGVLVLVTLERA